MENLLFLDVPIFKHIRVLCYVGPELYCCPNTSGYYGIFHSSQSFFPTKFRDALKSFSFFFKKTYHIDNGGLTFRIYSGLHQYACIQISWQKHSFYACIHMVVYVMYMYMHNLIYE